MLDALKNNIKLEVAYTVNGVIYALKQIPLIKKILPQKLYSCKGLKVFGTIVMLFIRFIEIFLYKVLYTCGVFNSGKLIAGTPAESIEHAFFKTESPTASKLPATATVRIHFSR